MAGEMERDARLILRAEDRASKTFDQVTASIKRVREEIAKQSKAVEEGRGDIGAYNKALDELKAAGDDLIKGQSLITQFQKQGDSIEKAEERLRSATAALDAYRKKAGENPTDSQSVQIEKKVAAVTAAQGKLEQAQQRLVQIEGRMARAGIATNNLEQQFDEMASAAVMAAQGIAAAKNAIDDYPNAVKRATAAAEEFAAAQTLGGRDTSFLNAGEFDRLQSLDSAKAKLAELARFEELEARSAKVAAAAETARRQAQRVAIDDVFQSSKRLEAQFAGLTAQQARMDDLKAFRQIGIDAAESAVKVERYAASVQSLGNDFQSFSAQVRGALGGTSSGLQDIGQALTQIDASAATLAKPKAKINELQESTGQLSIAIATLDRTARQIDGFRQMQTDVQRAEAVFGEAQAEVLRLAQAVGQADEPVEQLERELAQAQQTLSRAGREMQNTRNKAVEMGAGLRKAGIDADNLDAEMARLQIGATKAGTTFAGLSGKVRGRGGFLGLNAFEMQNLGYQVNDVFTQLGSGTPILQVLAQQGPQIIQLFQGLGSTLLRLSPVIAAVLLLLSPFISAMLQAAQATEALRTANTLLAGTGQEGGRAAAAGYAEASINLQNLGASAKDATAVLTTFRDSGLDPSALTAFTNAIDLASKGGADMTETAKLLSDALTGNAAQVEALNDKFNILTPSEEAQVVAMIESGNESEARRIIFEKFEATSQRMADSARGPWSKAWDDLTFAFRNFTRTIADSAPFRALNGYLNTIGQNIRGVISDMSYFFNYASKRGVFGAIGDAFSGKRDAEAKAFADRGGRPARGGTEFPGESPAETKAGNRAIRERTRDLEDARNSTRKLSRAETEAAARRKALRTAVGSPQERQRQAQLAGEIALVAFDDKAAKAAASAGKRADSAAERARKKREAEGKREARAAETLANQRRSIEEQLVRDLDTLEAKVDKTSIQSIEERRKAIEKGYTGLFQKIEEFKRKGGTTIEGVSAAEYEKQVRAQILVLQNLDQMKGYEEGINAAIKDRTDQIAAVNDALDRGDISGIDATKQVEEIVSRFAPQISKLASDAIAFATSLRTAVPDPKLEAFISKFERVSQQNSAGQDRTLAKNFAQAVITDEARKLEQLIQQRDALVASENALVELGVKTRTQAQGAIEAAYARTTPLVAEQSRVLNELLGAFVAKYPEMQIFYDTWQAKLQGIAATSQAVDARFTQLKGGVDGLISGNAVAGIDAMAQALARLALGQQGALDTIKDLGLAFANFIAQTLIGIAKLILQMIILSAVEKATGIPVGALLKFMNASGLHTGGVVGQERTFGRRVPEAAFYGAPRYHGGGVAGFAPDEVPAILKRNEEVLTESDPRHRFNLGGSEPAAAEGGGAGTRNILVMDPSELASAMAGPAGEKMVVSHIRRNAVTIKQLVGG